MDEIENLQSLPMSDPIPWIEHLYFFLIFKDLNNLRPKNRYPSLSTWIATLVLLGGG